MSNTTDRVAFAAAELNAASDALVSAAAEVDALRAELARQTGIAVDLHERLDAAIAARDEAVARAEKAEARLAQMRGVCSVEQLRELTVRHFNGEISFGRLLEEIRSSILGVFAERDAAIAARDEAVANLETVARVRDAWIAGAQRMAKHRDVAERARDEVGIQLAAAQAEIARLRRVVDETRTLMATPACERLPAERAVCDALHALDTVPGDTLVRP